MACTCLITSWFLCQEKHQFFDKNIEKDSATNPDDDYKRRIQLKYNQLVNNVTCVGDIVAQMYQNGKLTESQLEDMNALDKTLSRANEELLKIIIKSPRDVYDCFLETLINTQQEHVFLILKSEISIDQQRHSDVIRRHYAFLTEEIESGYELIPLLYQDGALTGRETEEIDGESGNYKKNQRLLSIISRKSEKDFSTFKDALKASKQGHIVDQLEGKKSAAENDNTQISSSDKLLIKSTKTSKESPKMMTLKPTPPEPRKCDKQSNIVACETREKIKMDTKFRELQNEIGLQTEISIKTTLVRQKKADQSDDILNTCFLKVLEDSIQTKRKVEKEKKMIMNEIENIRNIALNAATNAAFEIYNYTLKSDLDLILEKLEKLTTNQKLLQQTNIKLEEEMKTNEEKETCEKLSIKLKMTRFKLEETISILKEQEEKLNNVQCKNTELVHAGIKQNEMLIKERIKIENLTKDVEELRNEMNRIQQENEKFREDLKLRESESNLKEDIRAVSLKAEIAEADGTCLLEKIDYAKRPTLKKTIITKASKEEGKANWGMTILNDEFFIVNQFTPIIEVYDSMTLKPKRTLSCPNEKLEDPVDIVSSKKDECLYIIDWKFSHRNVAESMILKVKPNGSLKVKWSTPYYGHLSVTTKNNIILVATKQNKIAEFQSDGQKIREIELFDRNIVRPMNAIEVRNDCFLVSHGWGADHHHRVCLVNSKGRTEKCFDGKTGKGYGEMMERPWHFVVDSEGFIIVVDVDKGRILLLNSSLEYQKELLSAEDELRNPSMVYLDESSRRLFVADNKLVKSKDGVTELFSDGRVLVFDMKPVCLGL